jgi:hypothetical protein
MADDIVGVFDIVISFRGSTKRDCLDKCVSLDPCGYN